MKRGALVNLLIGITIAILPLYNRVCLLDFQRTSKDNLMVIIFGLLGFLLPNSARKISQAMLIAVIYGLFSIVINQHDVLSLYVMMQCFYIASGILFFCFYYERHDRDSFQYILNGMVIGSLIQGVMGIMGYYGIEAYPIFLSYFTEIGNITSSLNGKANTIGSLGNSNVLASYLALTSLAFISIKQKWLVAIPLFAMYLANSYGASISLIAGFMYYLNFKLNIVKKWQIYSAAVVAMAVYPFSGIGHDSGRLEGWGKAVDLITVKHFFVGMGPGWFPDQKIMIMGNAFLQQEHCEYFSIFNIFGIVGIIILFPIFIKFITTKDKSRLFSSILFVAFLNSYGHFPWHISTTVIIMIPVLAICLSQGEDNEIG